MEVKNKKVFLRADFNVPVKGGVVQDTYRIDSTLKTLDYLRSQGSKTMIVSHIETKDVDKPTLKPVYEYMKSKYSDLHLTFLDQIEDFNHIQKVFNEVPEGGFLLIENIRVLKGEKENDIGLAMGFKGMVDVYINDAFAVSHRDHMSVSALPSLFDTDHKKFGDQMQKEIDNLSRIVKPETPFTVILSGAKFSTKLPLIEKYLNTADMLFIGGALLNNVLKSLGHNVGKSLIDQDAAYVDEMVKSENFITKTYVPQDVVTKNLDTGMNRVTDIRSVLDVETIQDIDEKSIHSFVENVKNHKTKTIVWNGPVGNYEDPDFKKGTIVMAEDLIQYVESNPHAHLFIGGGDTVAAVNSMKIDNPRVFVSTGGGAMLEFLEKDGKLPGVIHVSH